LTQTRQNVHCNTENPRNKGCNYRNIEALSDISGELVKERSCMNDLVISKSALASRSFSFLIQERSRRKVNSYRKRSCSLAAILSDLCHDTDSNLLYILSVPKLY